MPGRPEFSQPGTRGGGQTVATQDRPNVKVVDLSQTTTVAAGSTENLETFAPSESLYRIVGAKIIAPPPTGAASGFHIFKILTGGGIALLAGRSGYQTDIRFHRSYWRTANEVSEPPNEAAQQEAISSLKATESQPVEIEYQNQTDVDQTDNRTIKLLVEEATY